MQYQQSLDAWEVHVSAIMRADLEHLPPLILEYRGPNAPLGMHDGSHRHEALRRMGEAHVAALIWCNSEADFDEALPMYAGARAGRAEAAAQLHDPGEDGLL